MLITKAGTRWALDDDQRYKRLVPRTELAAYGRVAADILGLCMVPSAFDYGITQTLREHPYPAGFGRTRERAAQARAEWRAAFVPAVLARLRSGVLG
jgi:hypothetical protein